MRRIIAVSAMIIGVSLSGCVAVVAGAAGAGTVTCTQEELDCPVD